MRTIKIRKLIKLIESDGWFLHREKGSHRQYRHPVKSGLVTVPGHMDDDVNPATLQSILKQAGLKTEGT
jgi:predicted RNA binding protein YcfA (HicA-like mRNA interferase family)